MKDKRIIITGGTGGIGFALSKMLLQENAKVLLVDLDESTLNDAKSKFNSENIFLPLKQMFLMNHK